VRENERTVRESRRDEFRDAEREIGLEEGFESDGP